MTELEFNKLRNQTISMPTASYGERTGGLWGTAKNIFEKIKPVAQDIYNVGTGIPVAAYKGLESAVMGDRPVYNAPTGINTNTVIKPKSIITPTTGTGNTSNRDAIMALQESLNAKGANLKVDGLYGPLTRAAEQQFSSPGSVGSMTGAETSVEGSPFALTIDKGQVYQGQDGKFYYEDGSVAPNQAGQVDLPSEEETMANNLRLYQAQIDSINNMFADQINQSRITNAPTYKAREDQNRLQQIQGGIGSSPMGSAQTANVQSANAQEQASNEALINVQRANAVNAIMGEVRQKSTKDLEAKRDAKAKSADEYVKFLNEAPERKAKALSGAVKQLLAGGATVDELDEETIKALGGKSAILAEYNSQKAIIDAEAAKADLETRKAEANIKQSEASAASSYASAANSKASADKTRSEIGGGSTKNYDEKTIPSDVKSDLIYTLTLPENKKLTLTEVYNMFPEVNTEYLNKVYENRKN